MDPAKLQHLEKITLVGSSDRFGQVVEAARNALAGSSRIDRQVEVIFVSV